MLYDKLSGFFKLSFLSGFSFLVLNDMGSGIIFDEPHSDLLSQQ